MNSDNKDPFDGAEIIHVYSRQEAIMDGVLVDLSEAPQVSNAGFKGSFCLSRTLFDTLFVDDSPECKTAGDTNFRDLCWMASLALTYRKQKGEDVAITPFKYRFAPTEGIREVWLVFVETEGFTLMFPSDY